MFAFSIFSFGLLCKQLLPDIYTKKKRKHLQISPHRCYARCYLATKLRGPKGGKTGLSWTPHWRHNAFHARDGPWPSWHGNVVGAGMQPLWRQRVMKLAGDEKPVMQLLVIRFAWLAVICCLFWLFETFFQTTKCLFWFFGY